MITADAPGSKLEAQGIKDIFRGNKLNRGEGRAVSRAEDKDGSGGLKNSLIFHLMQGKGANTESGELHCVQQCDLDHAVGLCAATRPVLITLYL